uniref:Uncharacterized protein n=1 Tax=Magnetococcus massalia (strain MO-1) TaxID=451514 RepID=A0A1S7LH94_MAGMO|nr:conserved protein of unknown function [Candidatus Magnetococcus massalia]
MGIKYSSQDKMMNQPKTDKKKPSSNMMDGPASLLDDVSIATSNNSSSTAATSNAHSSAPAIKSSAHTAGAGHGAMTGCGVGGHMTGPGKVGMMKAMGVAGGMAGGGAAALAGSKLVIGLILVAPAIGIACGTALYYFNHRKGGR